MLCNALFIRLKDDGITSQSEIKLSLLKYLTFSQGSFIEINGTIGKGKDNYLIGFKKSLQPSPNIICF